MIKILKILALLFVCSICGIFNTFAVAQSKTTETPDGRMFEVYTTCRTLQSTGIWLVGIGWYANQDMQITSTLINGKSWNMIGAHPDGQLYKGRTENTFYIQLVTGSGYPSNEDFYLQFETYDGYKSEAIANLNVQICKPKMTPTPQVNVPVPIKNKEGKVAEFIATPPSAPSCPIVEIEFPSGQLICLQSAPY